MVAFRGFTWSHESYNEFALTFFEQVSKKGANVGEAVNKALDAVVDGSALRLANTGHCQ